MSVHVPVVSAAHSAFICPPTRTTVADSGDVGVTAARAAEAERRAIRAVRANIFGWLFRVIWCGVKIVCCRVRIVGRKMSKSKMKYRGDAHCLHCFSFACLLFP